MSGASQSCRPLSKERGYFISLPTPDNGNASGFSRVRTLLRERREQLISAKIAVILPLSEG